jgi:hypothetical protein
LLGKVSCFNTKVNCFNTEDAEELQQRRDAEAAASSVLAVPVHVK